MKRLEFTKNIALASGVLSTSSLLMGWGDYWLGGVWGPTSYMVLRGLTAYGKDDLAKSIAKNTCKNVATVFETTGTFWENYTPDLVSYGMPVKKYFCGWTALFPIAMYNKRIKET